MVKDILLHYFKMSLAVTIMLYAASIVISYIGDAVLYQLVRMTAIAIGVSSLLSWLVYRYR